MDAREMTVGEDVSEGIGLKDGGAEMEVEEIMVVGGSTGMHAGAIAAAEGVDGSRIAAENGGGGVVRPESIDDAAHGVATETTGGGMPPEKDVLPVENMQMDEGNENLKSVLELGEENADLSGQEETIYSGGEGAGKAGENAEGLKNGGGDKVVLSVAELVAKARAPVKSEFLTPAAVRVLVPNGTITGTTSNNGVWDEKSHSRFGPERKSKRQLKRDRLLAKKSAEGICAIVARSGDVKMCPYGANCQFNHDLESYKAQKPPDLPGKCPSLDFGEPCSYGIACRYSGTHKECDGYERVQERRSNTAPNELNSLSKELQKRLWKNMGSYPKADAQLQAMGLMSKAFKLRKVEGEGNQMQEPVEVAKEELRERPAGTGPEADKPMKESTLEPISTEPVESTRLQEQVVEGTTDSGANVCDTPKNVVCTAELVEPSRSVPSHTLEIGSHPPKRLRVAADETIGDTLDLPSKDNQARDCKVAPAFITATKLDEDEYKTSAMDVSGADGTVNMENMNSDSKDSWRSLYVDSKLGSREKKLIDFREKLYLAPLTTVGNLPFRRVCKSMGADITCGEMAMCTNLLQGQASEWALLRRHSTEDFFGVQICGSFPDHVARTAELIEQECTVDFVDINMGCPIDLVVSKGAGSCLLTKPQRLEQLVRVTASVMESPLTLKVRMGYYEGRNCAHTLMPNLSEWGVSAVTIHGRTRQQRYSKVADWAYVEQCVDAAKGNLQVIGNGDVFSYTDWTEHLKSSGSKLSTCMIARGALIKPWLFREIKEGRHWDISSGERLDILRQYVHCGLAHWGSDSKGVETTRHFLLEWLSYMHRYIPVGLLDVVPQRLNWRPPSYFGRNDLETMMASESAADWVRITELLLGPTPANFVFNPKHKSNAYDKPENG